jgi:WD40 repeat protein
MKNIQHLYKSTAGASVVAVCFQKQGGLLTVAMDNGQIAVLDSGRGFETVAEFDTGFGIASAEVHPTEPLLAIAGQKKLEIRDMEKGRRVFHYQFDEGVGLGSSMVFHPASSRLFFGGYDYDIISVDYTAADTEVLFTGAEFNICFTLHPAGNIVASSYVIPQDGSGIGFFLCTPDGDAVQYDTPHIGIGAEVQPRIAFSADGRLLVAAYADLAAEQSEQDIRERGAILGTVQIYEFPSCRKVHTAVIKGESGDMEKSGAMYRAPDELSNVVLPGDGQHTACGTAAGTVVLIDNKTGSTEHVYRIGDTAVTALALISKTTFAAGCADGTVVLCECSDFVKKSARDVEPSVVEKEFLRLAEEGEW